MNKVCLLVGGSKGLGSALLDTYVEGGFRVVEFSRSGESEHHVSVDLSRRETAIDTIDEAMQSVLKDSVDEVHLILNAAVLSPAGRLYMSEPKQWWSHIDVNFTLPISIMGRFQTLFKDAPCRKVVGFVSSGAARTALDGWSLYCASKAGVEHFIRTMAFEQARLPHPIECANLNPGVMDTDMQATIRSLDEEQFTQVEHFQQMHSEGVLASPSTVASNIFKALSKPFESGAIVDVSAK